MQKHPELTLKRIRKVLNERVKPLIYPLRQQLSVEIHEVRSEPIPAAEVFDAPFEPFEVGRSWGPAWTTAWFRMKGTVPTEWEGRPVNALIRVIPEQDWEGFTPEALLFQDGKPVRGINNKHPEHPLTEAATGGETFEFMIEAAANRVHGDETTGTNELEPQGKPLYVLQQADLAVFDPDAWGFYHDLFIIVGALENIPQNTPRWGQLLYAANDAVNQFDPKRPETCADARMVLQDVMSRRNGDTAHKMSAIGHAHIDTAWLWPLRETIRKCARTFSTALRYMEEYPEYVFGCSQPQQYIWMKELYPTIWEDIKKRVQTGQWEPIGSMWIEADCNIPSGESLIRQILHGKRFFLEEFGYETIDLWLPDVFGYSAALPQILKKSGIRYFLTQKISWSQFNRFPHHTFMWEGIDGTRMFTHFPPADTYNAVYTPEQLKYNEERFLDHDRATRSLYVYGYGDGGGGPSLQMMEAASRLKDFEGLPQVQQEKVADFFPKAEEDAIDPPVWVGELYLELHRGTLTTHARNKRDNRKCEVLLRDAEWFDALDHILAADAGGSTADGETITDREPPRAKWDVYRRNKYELRRGHAGALDRAWKLLLLNQFHDIIPGSSVNRVYRESAEDYATIKSLGELVSEDSLRRLAKRIGIDETYGETPLLAMNTLGMERAEIMDGPEGAPMLVEMPSFGYNVINPATASDLPEEIPPVKVDQQDEAIILDNGLISVTINKAGQLESVLDLLVDREVIEAGQAGNVLRVHPDDPHDFEAWDVDIIHKEKWADLPEAARIEVIEAHPMRAVVEVEHLFGKSRLVQRITLAAGSQRIDFSNKVDWQERRTLLRVVFPVSVQSPRATYEIQYGNVERPTHTNTTWDMAKFEVCGHKWADLSEGDYGVALLNDCKYAYDIHGNVLSLSLLRGTMGPDPRADIGQHEFTYALLPHEGNYREGGVIEQSYSLNMPAILCPLKPAQEGELPAECSWFSVDRPGVFIESVKISEDGDALIVRLYEAFGTRGPCSLACNLPLPGMDEEGSGADVCEADLLERDGEKLEFIERQLQFQLKPFEIRTFKFRLN